MAEKKERVLNERYFFQDSNGVVMLVGSKCNNCNKVFFPKKRVCPYCFVKDEMEIVPLSKKGKLVSYGVCNHTLLAGFKPPYACGYVDLPEKVRLFALLTDCYPFEKKLSRGLEVESIIEKIYTDEDSYEVLCYKFRPVEKGGNNNYAQE